MRYGTPSICLVLAWSGCAHVEPPPGGPPDELPPAVLSTTPAAATVVPGYADPVVFVFDERISERGIEDAVLVSPRTSPVEVRHGRQEIRVALRGGWEPDRVYHVTLRPDLADLFGNRLLEQQTLVFSTGPPIPDTRSAGTVVDRITGRTAENVRVEAIRTADSLVYAAPTDSAGSFVLEFIPPGDYQLRAFQDANRNRALEPFEGRDSAFAAIAAGEPIEDLSFRLLVPDSTPPVAGSATLRQTRVTVDFDDFLDPEQTLDPAQVAITGPTGAEVPVESVLIGSTQIFPTPLAADTPTADLQLPSRQMSIELGDSVVLEPEAEYVVTLSGVANVNGLTADVEVIFTTPPGPPAVAAVVSRRQSSRYIPRRRGRRGFRTSNFVPDNGRT